MGITGGFFKGAGDMSKTTYDPNDDGVIAVAQTEADMKKTVYDTDDDGKVENSDYINGVGGLCGKHMTKAASANLRNSHNADAQHTGDTVYTKVKTITLSEGIKGTITVKFKIYRVGTGLTAYGKIYKNGVAIGTERESINEDNPGEEFTENINFGTMEVGETIELWIRTNQAAQTCGGHDFRLYYDNIAIPVTVTVANS